MIEDVLRPGFQTAFVNPIADRLISRVSPNQVTVLSGIVGFLVLPALLFNHAYWAVFLLLLSGYLDTLDGTLARVSQVSSEWGSVLDIMTDRLVETVVIMALWSVAPDERSFWCLLMLGSVLLCITSFLLVGMFSANFSDKSFHYSPGLIERAEAFIFFIAMMLFPQAFILLSISFSGLVLLTAWLRLSQFYKASSTTKGSLS